MPETFELQVRTLFMHAWAEPQHNLGYKSPGDLSKEHRRHLAWIAASAWGADRGSRRLGKRSASNGPKQRRTSGTLERRTGRAAQSL